VAADTDDQYFGMATVGSKIAVTIRGNGIGPRMLTYDFSLGVESSGVEQLLDPSSKRCYIWNPVWVFNSSFSAGLNAHGAVGSIRNAYGRVDYLSYDSNIGTGDGMIEQFSTGTKDNGLAITSFGVVPPIIANPFMAVQMQRMEATHRTNSATTGSTLLLYAVDQIPTFSVPLSRVLNIDNNRQYQKQAIAVDQGQRGKTDAFWALWKSSAVPTGSVLDRIWRMVFQYTEVEN
jgi:hypothetical protein